MYALSKFQVSWKQLLSCLGFEEQGSKTKKRNYDKKIRVSTRNDNTSKSSEKVQEASPIARETISSKRNIVLQQEEEIKKESEFSALK
jgi:hypothetical protein